MQSFKTYHPLVNFTYFLFVIGGSVIFMHPLFLGISLFSGLAHLAILAGREGLRALRGILPLAIGAICINFLFNHRGITILAYFPGGNPMTLESVAFGLAAACMLSSVLLHFSCLNRILTSDKLLYLFGRLLPSLSLLLSMTFRFVPHFTAQMRLVSQAQRGIGKGMEAGIRSKLKNALSVLSVMITRTLENAVDTADSMRSRGFGLPGRTSFSLYTFSLRDTVTLSALLGFGAVLIYGGMGGHTAFTYYPAISQADFSAHTAITATAYALLCFLPILIEIREVLQWKSLQSKI